MPQFNLDEYVQVNERLEKFRADHPNWGLVSTLIYNDGKTVIVRAVITDDNGRMVASGMAEEVRGSSPVNRTSPLENCETSAWGRALANLGYEVKRSIASREEMEKASRADDRSEAAGAGTGPAAPPVEDEPWMKTAAVVSKFLAVGTPGFDGRNEQLQVALVEAGLKKKPEDSLYLDKVTEAQLKQVEQIVDDLTESF